MNEMSASRNDRAQNALPGLRARVGELRHLAYSLTYGISFDPDDHFLFMGLCFLGKQVEHADALLQLGIHADSELIARSMLEGLWQLKWANQDREVRAGRWRNFSFVLDWRTIQGQRIAQVAVDPKIEQTIMQRLAEVGESFHTAKARAALAAGQPLPPDPYALTWSGQQVRQLAEAVGDEVLYFKAYSDFSERHHWDPAGIARGLKQEGNTITYNANSASSSAGALAIAFQCLYESSRIVSSLLNDAKAHDLISLFDDYVGDATAVGIDPVAG